MINCPILAKLRAPGVDPAHTPFFEAIRENLNDIILYCPIVSTGSPFSFETSTVLIPS